MPRLNIIVLDQPIDDANSYRYAMWADVPVARQTYYANPTAKSVWLNATAADNTNLQSGAMVEQVVTQRIPSNATLAQIEGFLQQTWTAFQARINAANPWLHYGSTWDGIIWTIVTGT